MDSILDSLEASAPMPTQRPNHEPASTRVSPRDDTIANALLTLRETTRIYGDHHSLNDDTIANALLTTTPSRTRTLTTARAIKH